MSAPTIKRIDVPSTILSNYKLIEPTFKSAEEKEFYEKVCKLRETMETSKDVWFRRKHTQQTDHIFQVCMTLDKMFVKMAMFPLNRSDLLKCFDAPRDAILETKERLANAAKDALLIFDNL